MKFCSKCGKEIADEAVICPGCGCTVENNSAKGSSGTTAPILEKGEKPGLARAALVCSFLIPIVGIICGIIGAIKYKTSKLKKQCIAAIPISIVVWVLSNMLMQALR